MLRVRLIIAAVILAALVAFIWHDIHVTRKLKETKRELATSSANYSALQGAYAHERTIAKEASDGYQKDLAQLRTARINDPLPAVLCKRARNPVPTASAATERADAAGGADHAGEDEGNRDSAVDLGPQLDAFASACEENLARLTRLQEWVAAR